MTRFIACFAVATLVGGCGTIPIAAKDDTDVVPGLAVEKATKSSSETHTQAASTPGFCAKEHVVVPVNRRHLAIGACVATVIKSIRFKPPLIGCEVISDYPFVFKLQ
jgi:hypothetical protein